MLSGSLIDSENRCKEHERIVESEKNQELLLDEGGGQHISIQPDSGTCLRNIRWQIKEGKVFDIPKPFISTRSRLDQ